MTYINELECAGETERLRPRQPPRSSANTHAQAVHGDPLAPQCKRDSNDVVNLPYANTTSNIHIHTTVVSLFDLCLPVWRNGEIRGKGKTENDEIR